MEKYRSGTGHYADHSLEEFDKMLVELSEMKTKYIKQMLEDMQEHGYLRGFPGDYHRRIIEKLQAKLFEEIVLK